MQLGITTNRDGVMVRPIGRTTFSIILAGMLVGSSDLAAKGVTDDDIIKDQETPQDVVTYGMGPHIQRYSPLDQINTDNVKDLVPVWAFSFGGEKQRGQEAQPVVHNDKIFVTASYSRLFAVDAQTGEELWEYNHRLPKGILPCCDVINRGAVLYDNLVYFGTLDAQLVALDQDTGKVAWKVKTDHYKAGHSITMAPVIAKGMVIVGNAGSEFGAVGWVKAYDAKTGEEIWYRPLIEGHMGYLRGKENGITGETNATWPGDLWKTGGGAPWEQGSYDPELNLVYFGAGNPAPWNAHKRPGDNLYSASMVAIDVDTGKMVWHYQTVPNDSWDFDSSSELLLFDFEKDGKTVKAGAQANKNGYFYVLDRTNGELLNAFPFVKKVTWAKGIDMETGRPIETGNRPGNPAAGEKKGEVVFTAPSFLGGKNWNPMAYDPNNRLFYIPANEWGMDIWNEPISYKKGAAYLGAGFNIKPLFDDYIGVLRAIDPNNGEIVWEQKNRAPLWAGVLVTKGGLVFTGTPEGYVKAYDAKSGEELWKFQTGSGVIGSPITWEQDGEQYISVPSGWGGAVPLWGGEVAKRIKTINQGGSLWTFKLHKG